MKWTLASVLMVAAFTSSAQAAIIQALGPHEPAITIDGVFTDWASVPIYTPAAVPPFTAGSSVIGNMRMAHDASNLYIRYGLHFAGGADAASTLAHLRTLIDIDNTRTTGWRGGGDQYGIGGDYLVEGGRVYSYTGTGLDFSWNLEAVLSVGSSGGLGFSHELAVAWSDLGGSPTTIDFFAWAAGTNTDFYPLNAPAGAAAGEFFRYLVPSPSALPAGLTLIGLAAARRRHLR